MPSFTGSSAPYAALITSEHNQKPNFMALVELLTAGLGDVSALLGSIPGAFYIYTAQGAQLDIVGKWVGQSRLIPGILVPGFFGFSEVSTGLPDGLQLPFGELTDLSKGGIWYNLGDIASGTTTLTDPQYLTVLLARIARNQSNGTVSAIENALDFIFGAGCSVQDNSNKTIGVTVTSPISPVDQALLSQLDILPRPAGVLISSITYTP